ncbi:MAG: hypothetical protein WCL16_08870 [bacterium]
MSGLKSAFDLAMDRMTQRGEGLSSLTGEQKTAMAEIARRAKAKVAETEILFQPKLEAARSSNDPEKLATVEGQQRFEIAKIRERETRDREAVRGK